MAQSWLKTNAATLLICLVSGAVTLAIGFANYTSSKDAMASDIVDIKAKIKSREEIYNPIIHKNEMDQIKFIEKMKSYEEKLSRSDSIIIDNTKALNQNSLIIQSVIGRFKDIERRVQKIETKVQL